MNTDTRRAASARLHAERKAAGWRKVTVWLTPEAAVKLDMLKSVAGSTDEAVRQAIIGLGVIAAPPPEGMRAHTMFVPPLGATVQIGPIRAKPGERSKKPGKGK